MNHVSRFVSMASKGRMGIQDVSNISGQIYSDLFQWPAKAGWGFRSMKILGRCPLFGRFQWPAKAGWGFRQAEIEVRQDRVYMFQWPAKAGWGFRQCAAIGGTTDRRSFNGQQRPDGDSGRGAGPLHPGREVSMASKGRMGIQAGCQSRLRPRCVRFQWPAKAGWGFRLRRGVRRDRVPDRFNGQQRPDGDSGARSVSWARAAPSFNGQQRPDGDSGPSAGLSAPGRWSGFNGQQRPDGDSGQGWIGWSCGTHKSFNGQQRPDGDSGGH